MNNSETENTGPITQMVELPTLQKSEGKGPSILANSLDAIEHVKVRLTVQIGETDITIGELNTLKEEQVLKLDTLADAPVDILLEGRVVARGQLVAVDDNFGIRIVELPKTRG